MVSQRKGAGVNRRTMLKGMGAAGAMSVVGFPAIVRAQAKEIKIGSVQPMTGLLAVVGKTTRQGNQLAVDHVNAEGGINGRKITFISYDDAYSPPKAVEQARKLNVYRPEGVRRMYTRQSAANDAAQIAEGGTAAYVAAFCRLNNLVHS